MQLRTRNIYSLLMLALLVSTMAAAVVHQHDQYDTNHAGNCAVCIVDKTLSSAVLSAPAALVQELAVVTAIQNFAKQAVFACNIFLSTLARGPPLFPNFY